MPTTEVADKLDGPTSVVDRLDSLFAAIDAKDTDGFLAFLAGDASFRFGSAPAVNGHKAVGAAVTGFFETIRSSQHDLHKVLGDGSTLVCEGEVTYTRHDGSQLTVPFTDVFELDGDMIAEYKIYIDISALYAGD